MADTSARTAKATEARKLAALAKRAERIAYTVQRCCEGTHCTVQRCKGSNLTLKPLYRAETRRGGVTPFHALAGAVAHATGLLSSFVESGGKILLPSGEEVGVPSLKSGWRAGNDAG